VSQFGYAGASASVTIADGATTVQNFALVQAAVGSLSGIVRDNFFQPVANATVTIRMEDQTTTVDFDVFVEGQLVLFGYDIAARVGQNRADNYSFLATVTDGQLNVEFRPRRSFQDPVVNAIRVTHRPDR
jgi:hypothetical protein